MTANTGTAPASAGSRWKTWALVASVALNLLFIGAVTSAAWRFREHAAVGPAAVNLNLLGFSASLPRERRQAIWTHTAGERQSLRPLRAEVHAARHAVRTTLAAEPFDAAAFAQAQEKLLDAEFRSRKEAQKLLLAVATSLTAEERKAYAKWQPIGPTHRRGWWWRRHGVDEAAPQAGSDPAPGPAPGR